MKLIFAAILLAGIASSALAQGEHYVNGYTRADGTYVAPHYQTNPNGTRDDNWSTRGNVNPYTGVAGTKPRDGEGAYTPAPYTPAPWQRGASSYGPSSTNGSYGAQPDNSSFPPPSPY